MTDLLVKRVQRQFGADIETAENAVKQMQRAVQLARNAEKNTAEQSGVRHSFKGYDAATGKGIYESNFPKGTPKSAKAKVILDYIQNIWSKKPIRLIIKNADGTRRTIKAQFDPTFSDDPRQKTDASKLMGGNRHGNASEQRVTLDLADDYYQIAAEAEYASSKKEEGKASDTHKDVSYWHYFVNDILFQEYGESKSEPYRVTINVKERPDGHFVYSFSAERQNESEGTSTRQTLHADVTPATNDGGNAYSFENSIRDSSSKSNSSETKKSVKDEPQRDIPDAQEAAETFKQQSRKSTSEGGSHGNKVRFSKKEDGIHPNSTEAERYEILKNTVLVPATVNADKIKNVDLEDYNTRKKSSVEPSIKKLAEILGIVGVNLRNKFLDFFFQFSKKNIGKSLHHQLEYGGTYQDYVKAMSCFDELISNAVPVETHTEKKIGTVKENADLKQVYVLISAFRDGDVITPVQLEVKKFYSAKSGLYLTVALTKIGTEVLEKTPADRNAGDTSSLFSMPAYSLRSVLENVNPADGRFLKYVPDGFLNEAQKEAKRNALKRQSEEYAGYKKDTDTEGMELEKPAQKETPEAAVEKENRDSASVEDETHTQEDSGVKTDRELLSEVSASAAVENSQERKHLREYRETLEKLKKAEQKRDAIAAALKTAELDSAGAASLRASLRQLEETITRYESRLAKLESSKSLQALLKRLRQEEVVAKTAKYDILSTVSADDKGEKQSAADRIPYIMFILFLNKTV